MARAIGLLLILLGAVSAVLGALIAVAGFKERLLERDFVDLQRNFDADAWAGVLTRSDALPSLTPWNADLHELSGRVHAFAAERVASSPRAQIMHLRAAEARFEHSVSWRPSGVFGWLNLADIRYQLNPQSEQWRLAFERAISLGVRGNSIQFRLLALRERFDSVRDPALLQAFEQALLLGLNDDAWPLLGYLSLRSRLQWACDLAKLPEQAATICREQYRWQRP